MTTMVDLAGIGVGPFNLSLAALLEPVAGTSALFLEQRGHFAWHPEQMLPGARLQTSFLKDLVTPVDPTSRHSFLNYLRAQRRFYEFLNADQPAILRAEFADYLAWVAGRLGSLRFSWPVEEVGLIGDRLRLAGRSGVVSTGTIVVGTGKRPYLPSWAGEAPASQCLHSSAALSAMPRLRGKRVALVGGGQSGAELFLAIAQGQFGPAAEVAWISRRATFAALDETHFVNEWFTPAFVEHFHGLPYRRRLALRPVQKLAGDGISSATVREIYSHLYERRHIVGDGGSLRLLPAREVNQLRRDGQALVLEMVSQLDGSVDRIDADVVVLATGFSWQLPECLAGLAHRFDLDPEGRPALDAAFRLGFDAPSGVRVYVQNGGEHSHGIADPQLSLMAWRAATIVNDAVGRAVYDLAEIEPVVSWRRLREPPVNLGEMLQTRVRRLA